MFQKKKRTEEKKAPKGYEILWEVYDWLEIFVFAASVVLLVFIFIARTAIVQGPSMENTLFEGQALIMSDLFYTPEKGDIIVFQEKQSGYMEPIVKRVIATEGDVVDIDFNTWTVTVNGEKLEETYVKREVGAMVNYMDGNDYPYTVPDGKVFVMGDNRNHSIDSRSRTIGAVDERFIIGEVKFRVWPLNKFGTVN